MAMEPVVRFRLVDGAVSVLDERLHPAASRALDVPPAAKLLTAASDLSTVVVADRDSVIVAAAGRRFALEIARADSATLLPDGGRLLITAPVIERRVHRGRAYEAKAGHLAYLIDVESARVVDRAALEVDDALVAAVPHPHDGSVLLEAGMGQDGCTTYAARVTGDRLALEQVLDDIIAVSFAPSGDRLLLTPHPSFNGGVSIVDWPGTRTIARLTAGSLDLDGDAFDLYGCFLSDERVLLKTYRDGLLLCSGDLEPIAWIDLPAPFGDDPEASITLLGLAEDAFAVDYWEGGSSFGTLWRIPL